eukprot:2393955-Rhodomonas_salina.1
MQATSLQPQSRGLSQTHGCLHGFQNTPCTYCSFPHSAFQLIFLATPPGWMQRVAKWTYAQL